MTNLDNIRQMNSEELAYILSKGACNNCINFDDAEKCKEDCVEGIKAWLEQEVTPTLTDDEKIILRNIDKRYKWIARESWGTLRVHTGKLKPRKEEFWGTPNEVCTELGAFDHLFKFIKWEDEEPYEISKLLGE